MLTIDPSKFYLVMTVRDALIGEGLLKKIEESKIVYDEWKTKYTQKEECQEGPEFTLNKKTGGKVSCPKLNFQIQKSLRR